MSIGALACVFLSDICGMFTNVTVIVKEFLKIPRVFFGNVQWKKLTRSVQERIFTYGFGV